jgi:uncharacterized protein YecE (DUF72 family)
VAKKDASCHIGTSGWHYEHWKGPFYPGDFSEKDFLSFYSNLFSTVEINNSFYHLPSRETFEQWRDTVDSDFLFAVKASRYITHMKKLKDPEESLAKFLSAIEGLKNKLGIVLFQLPPYWHKNEERLDSLLSELPKKLKSAWEFRDKSWFDENVYKLLSKYNAAFCIYDIAGEMSPEIVTADYIYVRLHGPDNQKYQGNYSKYQLNSWAEKFHKWTKEGKETYCYFDNDQNGYAAKNAMTLQRIVSS